MDVDRRSPNWEKFWQFWRVKDLAEKTLSILTLDGATNIPRVKECLELLHVNEYRSELAEDLTRVQGYIVLFGSTSRIKLQTMATIMKDLKALADKSEKLRDEQKKKCEQEDREIVFREILGIMLDAGDEIPVLTSNEQVKCYLQTQL